MVSFAKILSWNINGWAALYKSNLAVGRCTLAGVEPVRDGWIWMDDYMSVLAVK